MPATRYQTKEKANIEVYGKSGNFIAEIKNVSMTGACLQWALDEIPLSKGDLLRLTVVLKAVNRKHNINAEVIWKSGAKTGISFIKSGEVLDKMMERA
jgi:hypothetical protein